MPQVESIPVEAIRMDGNTQSRAKVSPDVVNDYTEKMRSGEKFPPIDVYFDGKHYWPADGFHRTLAAVSSGQKTIKANIHTGTVTDARLHAAGANAVHGLMRSADDKRHAVKLLLDSGEWADKAVNWLASQCRVSFHLAKSVHDEWHKSREVPVPTVRETSGGHKIDTSRIGSPRNVEPPKQEENPNRPPEAKTDSIGRNVSPRYEDALICATDARNIIRDLGAMVTRMNAFKSSPGGAWFNFAEAERCLKQAQEELKFAAFHCECPKCLDKEPSESCKCCKGHGWINRGIFGRLSDKDKQALGMAPF